MGCSFHQTHISYRFMSLSTFCTIFPEIFVRLSRCRWRRCTHFHMPIQFWKINKMNSTMNSWEENAMQTHTFLHFPLVRDRPLSSIGTAIAPLFWHDSRWMYSNPSTPNWVLPYSHFFTFTFLIDASVGVGVASATNLHVFSLSSCLTWWPCNVETSSENICSNAWVRNRVCSIQFDQTSALVFAVIEWIWKEEGGTGIDKQKELNKLSISDDHLGLTPASLIEKVLASPRFVNIIPVQAGSNGHPWKMLRWRPTNGKWRNTSPFMLLCFDTSRSHSCGTARSIFLCTC